MSKLKLFAFFFIIFSLDVSLFCQNLSVHEFEQIELNEFYDTKGVIIPDSISHYMVSEKRFTPSIDEVIEAEKTFRDLVYTMVAHNDYYTEMFDKQIRKYYRQYIGFVKNGNRIINIIMYDFSVGDSVECMKKFRTEIIYPNCGYPKKVLWRYYFMDITSKTHFKGSSSLLDQYWLFGKEYVERTMGIKIN